MKIISGLISLTKMRVGLRARISLATILIVLTTTLALTLLALAVVKRNMKASIEEGQFARLVDIAQHIDQKFESRKILLKTFAQSIPLELVSRPEIMQAHLLRHSALKLSFDAIAIVDPDGTVLANYNGVGPIGKSVSNRSYFKDTLAQEKGVISRPIVNMFSNLPQVMMTEPVLSENGVIVAIIAAAIDLHQPKFLGDLASTKFGQTGYLFIFNSLGVFIDHPDKARILGSVWNRGRENSAVKKAIAGYEGSAEAVNSYGIDALYTFKRTHTTDWIIGALHPKDEAFAAISSVQKSALISALVLAVLAGLIASWVMRRQLDPLLSLHQYMLRARDGNVKDTPIVYRNDEIGDLGHAFNELMRTRDEVKILLQKSEHHLRSVLTNAGDAFVSYNATGSITEWNRQAEETFGWRREEAIGKCMAEVLIPTGTHHTHSLGITTFKHIGEEPVVYNRIEVLALHRNGHCIPVELSVAVVGNGENSVANAFMRDITERRHAEAQIFEEKERLRVTLRSIGDAVITTDTKGHVTFLNPIAELMTGWRTDEAIGRPIVEVFNIVNRFTGERALNPIDYVLENQKSTSLAKDTLLIQQGGGRFPIDDSAAPIEDADGQMIGTVLVFHDVSQAHEMAEQMVYQATHDSLTGLINRKEFERRLGLALHSTKVENIEHTLLYLDLDQFKIVNDTCGHIAGDELLRQVTLLLQSKLRQSDTFARLGGDEFGVLLDSCPALQGLRIADVLRETVGNFRFVWQEKAFPIGVSIGLVSFSNGGVTLADIMRNADSACYLAKDRGRNRIHIFSPDDKEICKRQGEMSWVGRIHQALEKNQFVLYSQKIMALATDGSQSEEHYEILLRLKDESGGVISPMAFIPAAERYGLMSMIDQWVIKAVFSHHATHRSEGICCINLSGTSICDAEFMSFLQAQFEYYGVSPQDFCFEVTETAAIANLSEAAALIRSLKEFGCRIALDDFGSGMSSFAYLKHLPVDYLKIDGGFVKNMVHDRTDFAMVEAINRIGHVMGIKTIAEFVDGESTVDALRSINVDFAQGYGIEKPRLLGKTDINL